MRIHFIQHVAYESPGYLLQWAAEQNHTVTFTRMFEATVFPSIEDFDWLIVMGGPMGVYDEDKFSFLESEKAFIRSVINAGKKVLGICLGSQLVAEALGAKVYPHIQKEIGWWPVKKTANGKTNPVLENLPDEYVTFHWHGDTFDLPPASVHLLQSDACPHQAYLYKDQVMGLQFHMEAIPDLVKAMVANGRSELVPDNWIQSEKDILENQEHYAANNRIISDLLTAFVNISEHSRSYAPIRV
jgi:GMP synthase-like glutamine amidotransferase